MALFTLLPTGLPAAAIPREGREPVRMVTTSPAAAEVVFQLGIGDGVVGTVEWSDYPQAARRIPRVGPLAFPGLEAILRARPTHVVFDVTQPGPDWSEPLARAGVTVFRWTPDSVNRFFASTRTWLEEIHAPETSRRTLEQWQHRWDEGRKKCGVSDRVLLLASADPAIAFGRKTFLVDAVAALGFRPILPGRLSGFASVGPDWMRGAALDRVWWIAFPGPSPAADLRRLVGATPRLEALDADRFSRPGWTALEGLLERFCGGAR